MYKSEYKHRFKKKITHHNIVSNSLYFLIYASLPDYFKQLSDYFSFYFMSIHIPNYKHFAFLHL